MPIDITMPKLSESVVEGTIVRWLKRPGDAVALYEPLLEIETDKVSIEVPSPAAGMLQHIEIAEGVTVRIGALLARIVDPEEQVGVGAPAAVRTSGASDAARFLSPVVRRMGREHRIDLSVISGTGLGGRVTKKDVQRYLEQRKAPIHVNAPSALTRPPDRAMVLPTPAPPATADTEILPISPLRRAIAEHLSAAVRTAPHVTSVIEADLLRVVQHREQHRAEFADQGVKLTYTPYFVQAVIAGLDAVPLMNAAYTETGIIRHRRKHIGIAVALEDGLIVPVIHDADERNLLGLARAVGDLAERARARRLAPEETRGGTFTITNHGTGGSLLATPIINQGQAGILGIGAIRKRPVVITQGNEDLIAVRPICFLSLTFDHRLIDGAVGDRFLGAVKHYLEEYPA